MRLDRAFLGKVAFSKNEYASIVQTNYPGAHDDVYRARVAGLIAQAKDAWPHLPRFEYTKEEHENWRLISEILLLLQDRYACEAFLEGRDKLALPVDRIPQLDEVSARMEAETGMMLGAVGGLLDKAEFMPMLAKKVMRCTPYIRHSEYPFFTPEPDIVHELRGHASMFMHKPFVEVSVAIGEAAQAAVDADNEKLLDLIGLYYWYTVEYGLIRENGKVKVFGAGNNAGIQDLLRSMDPSVEKKPFNIDTVRQLTIDYDAPQEVFFVAESYEQIADLANELRKMA